MTKNKKELVYSISTAVTIFFIHLIISKQVHYVASIILFIALFAQVSSYKEKINNPEDSLAFLHNIKGNLVIKAFLAIWGIFLLSLPLFSQPVIGHPFEKREYTTKYYVNLFTTKGSGLNYRVPAEIYASNECNSYDDETICTRYYHANVITFYNGRKLTFYEDYHNLELNKLVSAIDDKGNEWRIELTDVKVRKK